MAQAIGALDPTKVNDSNRGVGPCRGAKQSDGTTILQTQIVDGNGNIIASFGGGSGGGIGTTSTPNISQIVDGTTSTQKVAVDTSGRLSVAINAPLVSSSSSLTSQTASASSKQLLPANTARKGSYYKNESATSTMFLAFAATATTSAYTEQIPPGGSFANTSGVISQGAVSAIWTDNTAVVGNARITEFL